MKIYSTDSGLGYNEKIYLIESPNHAFHEESGCSAYICVGFHKIDETDCHHKLGDLLWCNKDWYLKEEDGDLFEMVDPKMIHLFNLIEFLSKN